MHMVMRHEIDDKSALEVIVADFSRISRKRSHLVLYVLTWYSIDRS